MNYLSVENISKSFGEVALFSNVSFGINKDQKIAFIAKNGTGKTTILNIIAGLDSPDSGQVVSRKGIKIEYLSQEDNLDDSLTVEETIFNSDNETLKVIEEYEKALKENKITYYGNFRFLGYNAPYQFWGRKNEIIVSIYWNEQ